MSGLGAAGKGQAQGSNPPFNVSSLREELPSVEGGVSEGEGEDDEISSVESSEEEGEQRFEPAEEQPFTGSQAAQTVTAADGGVATSQGKKRYTDEEWAAVKKAKTRKTNERRKARRTRVRTERKTEQAKKREEEKERKEKEEAARAQFLASVPTGPRQEQAPRPYQPRGGLSSSRGRGGFTPSQPMRGYAGGQSHPPARPTSGNLPWSPHQSRWSSPMGGSVQAQVQVQVQAMEKKEKEAREAAEQKAREARAAAKKTTKARKEAAAEKKKAEEERSDLARINASLLAEQQRMAASLDSERGANRTIGEINLEAQALQDRWSAMRDGWLRQQTQAMMQGASLAVEQWERLILQADGMLQSLSLAHTEATNWVRDPSVTNPMERLRRRLRELQTGPQSPYQAVETIRNSREFRMGTLPTPPASLPSARRPLHLESGDVEMDEGEERGRRVVRARETRGREATGSTGAFGGGVTINNTINHAYPPASGYGQYPVIHRRVRDDDEMEIEPASPVETETPWDSRTGRLPGQRLITGTAESTIAEDQPTFRPRGLLTGGSQQFDLDGRSIGEDNVFDQSGQPMRR